MIGVAILGSTGSIGRQTLEVVEAHRDRFRITALAAGGQHPGLVEQLAAWPDAHAWTPAGRPPDLDAGRWTDGGLEELATADGTDMVVVATTGMTALPAVLAGLQAGKRVALANKETLVAGGHLVAAALDAAGGDPLDRLRPVDSEHSAIWQCLLGERIETVQRLVLTASGGPFRDRSLADLEAVTPGEALAHPTWQMGPKITVDSATLMNKALEVIEARWLFDLPPDRIEVVIHPESMVHSFVEFADGSVLAQVSPPDMRLPIQYALTYPERVSGPARRVDWRALSAFHFEQPDRETFPALDLGYEVAARGGTAGAVLNAANEAAVEAFLARRLPFLDIPRACRAVLDAHPFDSRPTLDGLLAADRWARQEVRRWTSRNP